MMMSFTLPTDKEFSFPLSLENFENRGNSFGIEFSSFLQVKGSSVVDIGIDLREFYLSVEWDILAVPAFRNEEYYTSRSN